MESRDDALLSQRLAALPLESPAEGGWNQLRERIGQLPTPRRRLPLPGWLALAASVAAVTVMSALWQSPPAPVTTAPTSSPAIGALVQRSQQLESEIRGLREHAPDVDEMRYAWESAVEDDLAVVDARLTGAESAAEGLWRERVRLLEELKAVTQTDTGTVLLQARLD